jgi:protein phosphatase|tara:strand:- start:161 stop:547 length:387 start_codon:yes stop_codon:yes gene_type:complete
VGDSRLYLYRERALRRITKDHSLAQNLTDKGFYTEAEAREANVGYMDTHALGTKVEVEVDTVQQELELHDVLLLCSDGLTDMISDWQIAKVITENAGDLDSTTDKLVDLANKHGGKDNISVILMQIIK